MGFNDGLNMAAAAMPADAAARAGARAATRGALIAWDPVNQREVWRHQYQGPWNGGLLSTAGGLVFQGSAAGNFAAFDTANGRQLWSFPAQTGIVAAPVTYTIDGQQYVAVMAGWGGVWALAPGVLIDISGPVRNVSRLLVFRIGGTARLPAAQPFTSAHARSAGGPRHAAAGRCGRAALRTLLRRLPRRFGHCRTPWCRTCATAARSKPPRPGAGW